MLISFAGTADLKVSKLMSEAICEPRISFNRAAAFGTFTAGGGAMVEKNRERQTAPHGLTGNKHLSQNSYGRGDFSVFACLLAIPNAIKDVFLVDLI